MEKISYVRRALLLSGLLLSGLPFAQAPAGAAAAPRTLRVGPAQRLKSLAAAAREARDGMLIEVEAGDYLADVAVWHQQDLALRAVGGRVRMIASGASAEGKAIFVTRGERMRIEGLDFIGCTVPDRNGAGIRMERGSLFLKDCRFRDNENGILTGNDPAARLSVEDCEFGPILRREGQTHNLYAGRIAQLSATGCWFHHGRLGHLLKSRATVNHIFYNRLMDDIGGEASYELEFPNGGQALVIGNLIQQSATTDNALMVSFGAEGYAPGMRQELQLVHNTLIDQLPSGGSFLRVSPGLSAGPVQVRLINNLLAGKPFFAPTQEWESRGNHVVDWDAFVLAVRGDYALKAGSPLRGKAIAGVGESGGVSLAPTRQVRAPRGTLALAGPARNPGAIQIP